MIRWFLMLALFCTSVVFPQQGLIKTLYKNGKVESEINYSNNIRNGEAKFYFENGNAKRILIYVNGKVDGLVKEFYENGKLKLSYTISNGKKEGPVSFFREDGSFINDISYEQGKRIFENTPPLEEIAKSDSVAYKSPIDTSINVAINASDSVKTNLSPPVPDNRIFPDSIYSKPDVMPEPKGGLDGIAKRVFMPGEAKVNKVSGIVKIEAVIDQFGDVVDDKILEDIGYNCGESAKITVLYSKFKPGLVKGIPVKVRMIIPVEFKSTN